MDKTLMAKKAFVYLIVIPVCFIWDLFYKSMQQLMKVWDFVDSYGDDIIEEIHIWSSKT